MTRLANFSGQDIIRILQKHFGFFFVSQKGSHIKIRCSSPGRIATTIVPDHSELAPGTVRGILDQAQVAVDDFLRATGRL